MSVLAALKPNPGATHSKKRLGRGDASGLGSTSGKGHKGQKARTGGKIRRGFEGGQMPIMRRLPKLGFSNVKFQTVFQVVSLTQLSRFDGDVTPETMAKAGLVKKNALVKILANGKLDKKLTVKAHKFSQKAKEMIEASGGKVEVIE